MPLPAGLTPVGGGLPPGLAPVDEDVQPSALPPGLTPVDFSDVKGGSSTTQPTYWGGVKSRFDTAIRHPMEAIGGALDPLVKPIRESLQQGGITGEMLPDIAKQAFGRKAGGFVEGLEKDVAPGLVSGENVAITAEMLAAPQSAAFLLPKFGKEGAQQAIASTQAPAGETPEEAGRRYAQGVGGAAMALAPIIHGAASPAREVVSRFKEPAARLDFADVTPEDMAPPKNTVSRFNLAESDKAFRLARDKQAALEAMKKFEEELPEPPAPKEPVAPPAEPAGRPGFAEDQGFDPRVVRDFNDWADQNRPKYDDLPQQPPKPWAEWNEVIREIQDAAAEHAEKPTDVEIQEATRQLDKLDRAAAERQSAEAAAGGTGARGSAVGPLGEAAGATGERAADPAARSRGLAETGSPGAGGGAEAVAGLPGGELRHNQATINEFRRQAGHESIDESRNKTTFDAIKEEAEANVGPIVKRLMTRKPGDPISAVENAAANAYMQKLAENPTPEGMAQFDHLSSFTFEGRSTAGRTLGFGRAAMDPFATDPVAAVQAAMRATNGKLSREAKTDVVALAQKAKVRKEMIDKALEERQQAAIERLEKKAQESLDAMKHEISKLTIKDVLGCR